MSDFTAVLTQLANQQVELQRQVTRMAENLANLPNNTPAPAAAAATSDPDKKSSTKKPEPFTGKVSNVQRFLSYFMNWAAKQNDIKNNADGISSALSFMQGDAADWGTCFAAQAAQSYKENATIHFPFEGKWENFEEEFKTRFGSLDEEAEARKEIKGMKQGQKTAAQYAQKFQDIGSRTGFSDTDLMERFCNGLN
ncbi:hypothetical protein VKT23_013872 [Stygiomarasmius scandens]|uniref:Retrotransposon gag domain-containing protein n=1 Tax=Marasmiellus scandens TaxID=2682957 RepID=A0ABR1J5Q6_9AGAR